MRLLKSGVFAYGPENIEPQPGSQWAINPYSFMHGFACWGDGELLDERMVPANQNPPNKGELPDLGFDWGQQVSMQMQCLNGEDTGTVVLYKGTSLGLRNAVKDLINRLIAQAKSDPDNIVPVVELEADSYMHKKHGQTFFPVLEVVKWVSVETGEVAGDEAAQGDDQGDDAEPPFDPDEVDTTATEAASDPEPAPAPKKRVRRRSAAAASGEATEPAKKKTAPRRRRAAAK